MRIAPAESVVRAGSDGVIYMTSPYRIADYPPRITERLEYWAEHAPDRTFLAQRNELGD